MFLELMPSIQHRPLTLTVAAINEKQIRVNVIPGKTDKDKAANKEIGHSHSKEVAPSYFGPDSIFHGTSRAHARRETCCFRSS